ncbi:hypothetical protein I7I50_03061 [Histoplasma capsulatum G186AR]|uniref:Uncharacterized protein n=1 Tax=Ajellomyces capsulatus TaxID=5037 RepID=A0A8H8D5H9_AJECA|nr:hypothetical protein I7I52_00273 [Histoplasma capsulatum]QSS72015.1 hypothetical protein I7I50_03061 [Histoplasma capsulatum G186AR]
MTAFWSLLDFQYFKHMNWLPFLYQMLQYSLRSYEYCIFFAAQCEMCVNQKHITLFQLYHDLFPRSYIKTKNYPIMQFSKIMNTRHKKRKRVAYTPSKNLLFLFLLK